MTRSMYASHKDAYGFHHSCYGEYLLEMAEVFDDCVDHGIAVVPVVVDPVEVEAFCAEFNVDSADAESRARWAGHVAELVGLDPWPGRIQDFMTIAEVTELFAAYPDSEFEVERSTLALAPLTSMVTDLISMSAFTKLTATANLRDDVTPWAADALAQTQCHHHDDGIALDESSFWAVSSVLSIAVLVSGSLIVRTSGVSLDDDPGPDTATELRGFTMGQGIVVQLSERELFSAFCTDAQSGDPVAPENGVTYIGVDTPGV